MNQHAKTYAYICYGEISGIIAGLLIANADRLWSYALGGLTGAVAAFLALLGTASWGGRGDWPQVEGGEG